MLPFWALCMCYPRLKVLSSAPLLIPGASLSPMPCVCWTNMGNGAANGGGPKSSASILFSRPRMRQPDAFSAPLGHSAQFSDLEFGVLLLPMSFLLR